MLLETGNSFFKNVQTGEVWSFEATFFADIEFSLSKLQTKYTYSKGGFKSGDVEGFSKLQKYIPYFYSKLFSTRQ